MLEFSPAKIRAFRYWIQGYQNFYEPIVSEYFSIAGYHVLAHPAFVSQVDIQRIVSDLFDGYKQLGSALDSKAIQNFLKSRKRLQPDFLLERDGCYYLAELKSWGGFNTNGQFTLAMVQAEFIRKIDQPAFLLVDTVAQKPIAGKLLVVSSRSPEHEFVLATLQQAYQTSIKLLYLDEIFKTPQLGEIIDHQLHYLDAAVVELRQSFTFRAISNPSESVEQ